MRSAGKRKVENRPSSESSTTSSREPNRSGEPPRREQTLKPRHPAGKVATLVEAERWRAGNKGRVAFTNGVFDLLHSGHIDVLTAARETADALIVGVNSDESVRRLKGPTRPVRSDAERAYVLGALECVDLVVIFPDDTPLNLVRHLKPDVIVKGGD